MNLTAIIICGVYSLLSTGCILHNKFILSSVMPHDDVLLIWQNVFTILFIICLGKYHDGSNPTVFKPGESLNIKKALIPRYTFYHSAGDWVVGFCYSLSVVTGLWCLFHSTVPTFSAVKKGGMFISWAIEAMTAPTSTTWTCLPSLLLVGGGAVVQAWFDLEFSALGITFGLLSCAFQSASFEIGKRMVTHGKDLWSVLLINSAVSLVVQFVYMVVFGNEHIIIDFIAAVFGNEESLAIITNRKHVHDGHPLATAGQVLFHTVCNCSLIMMMNLSIFINCTVNSPLAHVVTGNVKGIFTAILGIVMFSLTMHSLGYVGIAIGFLGGVWFSYVKYKADAARKQIAATQSKEASVAVVVEVPSEREALVDGIGSRDK